MANILNGSRLSLDEYFISMASLVARRATCLRRAVGCVITNSHGHVLATGYNGVASGMPHCNEFGGLVPNPALVNEDGTVRPAEHWEIEFEPSFPNACKGSRSPSGTNLTACKAIHAEQNALIQCRNINEIHSVYVTASPCVSCMRLLSNTSVKRIVFAEEYPHAESRYIAEARGIDWIRWTS